MRTSPEAALLAALGGRALAVQDGAADAGLPARPVLNATHLWLPALWRLRTGESQARLRRAALAHAAAHVLHSPLAQPAAHLKPMGVAVAGVLEDARVEALLARRLPGVARWFREAQGAPPDPHALDFASLLAGLAFALGDPGYRHPNFWVDKGRNLFLEVARREGLEHHEAFRRVASVLANDLGQMRVRWLPDQDAVPTPYRDDNSCLWLHGATAEAPTPAPQPGAPSATRPSGGEAPAGGLAHAYPEWDHRLGRERDPWCTVLEQWPPRAAPGAGALAPMRLAVPASGAGRQRRQWEGDALDLDAAVEAAVQRRLGLAPDLRVFTTPARRVRACSVLVLLDLSESANAVVQGRPLLQLQKEAALALARWAQASGGRVAVHGFHSNTRAEVHYQRLLDFGEPLAVAAGRIAAARARWSTRLGAAMRHATELALAQPGEARALVVVTDGVPFDVDVFDPAYLREDARVAVAAARRRGLRVECLAVQGDAAVPQAELASLFGRGHWSLVREPRVLAGRLTELVQRLADA